MVAATFGCRFCTISKQSLQLAQFAAGRIRRALRRPKPPNDNGKLAMSHTFNGKSMPNNEDKHWRNESSCWVAYSCVALGGRARSKKLALADAQNNNSNQAACKSPTAGILSKRVWWRRSSIANDLPRNGHAPEGCPRSPLLGLWSASGDPLSKPPHRGPTLELLARGLPCASVQRPLDSTLGFSPGESGFWRDATTDPSRMLWMSTTRSGLQTT